MSRDAWTALSIVSFVIAAICVVGLLMSVVSGHAAAMAVTCLFWIGIAAFSWLRLARDEDDIFSGRSGLVAGVAIVLFVLTIGAAALNREFVADFMRGFKDAQQSTGR